jgi:hypothetical protein
LINYKLSTNAIDYGLNLFHTLAKILTDTNFKKNMIKKWKGFYQYNSDKTQNIIGHPRTFFTIEMEIFEDDTLKGTVQEELSTGGMSGVGVIEGEVYENSIYFEKQMPTKSVILDKNGARETSNTKHATLYYVGELEGVNKYKGTWEFEKKWGFMFGIIPYKYCPGNGVWEMEVLRNEND